MGGVSCNIFHNIWFEVIFELKAGTQLREFRYSNTLHGMRGGKEWHTFHFWMDGSVVGGIFSTIYEKLLCD
jgi:hypothetical protein